MYIYNYLSYEIQGMAICNTEAYNIIYAFIFAKYLVLSYCLQISLYMLFAEVIIIHGSLVCQESKQASALIM